MEFHSTTALKGGSKKHLVPLQAPVPPPRATPPQAPALLSRAVPTALSHDLIPILTTLCKPKDHKTKDKRCATEDRATAPNWCKFTWYGSASPLNVRELSQLWPGVAQVLLVLLLRCHVLRLGTSLTTLCRGATLVVLSGKHSTKVKWRHLVLLHSLSWTQPKIDPTADSLQSLAPAHTLTTGHTPQFP